MKSGKVISGTSRACAKAEDVDDKHEEDGGREGWYQYPQVPLRGRRRRQRWSGQCRLRYPRLAIVRTATTRSDGPQFN